MKYYEVKLIADPGEGAATLDAQSKEAASFVSGVAEVYHATVHARPSNDGDNKHDVAVFLGVQNDSSLYEFAGLMARKFGTPMVNHAIIGEGEETLNYKADEGNDNLQKDAMRNAIDADDRFNITEIYDEADE